MADETQAATGAWADFLKLQADRLGETPRAVVDPAAAQVAELQRLADAAAAEATARELEHRRQSEALQVVEREHSLRLQRLAVEQQREAQASAWAGQQATLWEKKTATLRNARLFDAALWLVGGAVGGYVGSCVVAALFEPKRGAP